MYRIILIFSYFLIANFAWGQTNFRASLEKVDPALVGTTMSFEEKVKAHQAFLDQGIQEKDQQKQLFGYLYLFYDYIKAGNYVEAARYRLEANTIAEKSNNAGWKGWVSYRGAVLDLRLVKEKETIAAYKKAVTLCGTAGDSLCMAESWEQLSAMSAWAGNYAEAHHYFDLAFPIFKKLGSKKHQTTALSNYGNLFTQEGFPNKAIPYLKQALSLSREIDRPMSEGKIMNNLGNTYRKIGEYDKAIELLNKCLSFNKEHGFSDNMIRNYMALFIVYEEIGNHKLANEFLIKRYKLRDSITGATTQEKIAKLEAEYEKKEQELVLQKSQTKLITTQQKLERAGIGLLFLLLVIALGIWRWRFQNRQAAIKQAQNQENLLELTKILIEKNSLISNLEQQNAALNNPAPVIPAVAEENLFEQRILTKVDWERFKVSFEKTYPGYLFRLRSSCPSLSEAEERLFLFIKLKLTKHEIAAILGISADSVKRTRNRLRKRLELQEGISLEKYIHDF